MNCHSLVRPGGSRSLTLRRIQRGAPLKPLFCKRTADQRLAALGPRRTPRLAASDRPPVGSLVSACYPPCVVRSVARATLGGWRRCPVGRQCVAVSGGCSTCPGWLARAGPGHVAVVRPGGGAGGTGLRAAGAGDWLPAAGLRTG